MRWCLRMETCGADAWPELARSCAGGGAEHGGWMDGEEEEEEEAEEWVARLFVGWEGEVVRWTGGDL